LTCASPDYLERHGVPRRPTDLARHVCIGLNPDASQELWSFALPAGGQATPMTYSLGGKQYLVIAAGGHGKIGTKLGDYVLAFTLP